MKPSLVRAEWPIGPIWDGVGCTGSARTRTAPGNRSRRPAHVAEPCSSAEASAIDRQGFAKRRLRPVVWLACVADAHKRPSSGPEQLARARPTLLTGRLRRRSHGVAMPIV